MSDPQYSPMQQFKRRLYAMRNGIVADTLRRAGSPYRIIFGLNLPQLREIAASTPGSLRGELYADVRCRESRLVSSLLIDPARLTTDEAAMLLSATLDTEDADLLCHAALRHLPHAESVALFLLTPPSAPLARYGALRLLLNILRGPLPARLRPAVESTLSDPLTAPLATRLLESE